MNNLKTYSKILIEYNEKDHLTAITDPAEIAIKHCLDSIAPLSMAEFKDQSSIIDVGTGAGFPGIPMKIIRPGLSSHPPDSQNKRPSF